MKLVFAAALIASVSGAAHAQAPFHCPPSGASLLTSEGQNIVFTRQDGLSCLYRLGGVGAERGWFAGVISASAGYAERYREEFSKVWPAQVGSKVVFDAINGTEGWHNEIFVRERKAITVPAGAFDVLVIDVTQEGNRSNLHKSTLRYYWAVDFGFPVKHEPILERGAWGPNFTPKPWEAEKITRP